MDPQVDAPSVLIDADGLVHDVSGPDGKLCPQCGNLFGKHDFESTGLPVGEGPVALTAALPRGLAIEKDAHMIVAVARRVNDKCMGHSGLFGWPLLNLPLTCLYALV